MNGLPSTEGKQVRSFKSVPTNIKLVLGLNESVSPNLLVGNLGVSLIAYSDRPLHCWSKTGLLVTNKSLLGTQFHTVNQVQFIGRPGLR